MNDHIYMMKRLCSLDTEPKIELPCRAFLRKVPFVVRECYTDLYDL